MYDIAERKIEGGCFILAIRYLSGIVPRYEAMLTDFYGFTNIYGKKRAKFAEGNCAE